MWASVVWELLEIVYFHVVSPDMVPTGRLRIWAWNALEFADRVFKYPPGLRESGYVISEFWDRLGMLLVRGRLAQARSLLERDLLAKRDVGRVGAAGTGEFAEFLAQYPTAAADGAASEEVVVQWKTWQALASQAYDARSSQTFGPLYGILAGRSDCIQRFSRNALEFFCADLTFKIPCVTLAYIQRRVGTYLEQDQLPYLEILMRILQGRDFPTLQQAVDFFFVKSRSYWFAFHLLLLEFFRAPSLPLYDALKNYADGYVATCLTSHLHLAPVRLHVLLFFNRVEAALLMMDRMPPRDNLSEERLLNHLNAITTYYNRRIVFRHLESEADHSDGLAYFDSALERVLQLHSPNAAFVPAFTAHFHV